MSEIIKKCNMCNVTKSLENFYKNKKNVDGLYTYCKKCAAKLALNKKRTKEGLVSRIFHDQTKSCKTRGHEKQKYSKEELLEWCLSKKEFHSLFDEWKNSGFQRRLSPSIDRLDDYKTYSFDNIQIVPFFENEAKANSDRKNGINNKMNKAVVQISLGDGTVMNEFHSLNEAGRKTEANYKNIFKVCNGERKSAGGFKWMYKKDYYANI